jgi:DNA invertase Pin-like site-specific DNA recombinase
VDLIQRRHLRDLLTILRKVTEAGAKFRSLKDPWADTTTPRGELMVMPSRLGCVPGNISTQLC